MRNLAIRLLAFCGLQPIPRVRHIVVGDTWEPSEAQLQAITEMFREA